MKPLGSGKYLIVALDQDSAPFTTYPSSAADVAKLASIATTVELVENEVREVSLAISKLPQ